jgi:hypothetical protein
LHHLFPGPHLGRMRLKPPGRRGPQKSATCGLLHPPNPPKHPPLVDGKEGVVGSSPTPGFIRTPLRRGFRGVCPRCEAAVNHFWATDWATLTYVIASKTSVRRRMRPHKLGPRFAMSETTTRKEDGHERITQHPNGRPRSRRLRRRIVLGTGHREPPGSRPAGACAAEPAARPEVGTWDDGAPMLALSQDRAPLLGRGAEVEVLT